jgi:hypothetical protein
MCTGISTIGEGDIKGSHLSLIVSTGKHLGSGAIWWLHPRFAVLLFGIPLLIIAYLISDDSYLQLYRSIKYVDFTFLLIGLVIYVAFIAGSFFAVSTGMRSQERDVLLYCRRLVWPLFALTIFGYIVWYASAVLRTGDTTAFTSAVTEAGFQHTKFELFETIPGITTISQLGILYVTVEALLWLQGGADRRLALMRFAAVASCAFARGIVISERLSIIEIAIPVAVVFLTHSQWPRANRLLVALAPLWGVLAVFALFAFGEYFRSWSFYQAIYTGSYLQFAAERILGYYATAINNAAIYYYHHPVEPLRFTLTSLFEFPIVGEVINTEYEAIFGSGVAVYAVNQGVYEFLRAYTNAEFNNLAPIGALLTDFSIFLAPVAAFFIGLISFSLYRSMARGRLVGVILYPSWFIGLLEISRLYYWPNQRYFPTLIVAVATLSVFIAAKRKTSAPPTTLAVRPVEDRSWRGDAIE